MNEADIAELMRAAGGGAIVNIASVRSVIAGGGNLLYDTTKAAVAGMTRALAADHSAEGIRVNAVAPGVIVTPMTEATRANPERLERFVARIPCGRLGQPEEIAAPVVFDPVMIATSGAPLLQPVAVRALCLKLLPLASLITPNLNQAQELVGAELKTLADLRDAARQIQREYHCAALVKGGHLRRSREAVDVFFDGRRELLLAAPFVRGVATHGTGCTYSAAIAAHCARGHALPTAVRRSKTFITRAIATSYRIGKHTALNPLG